MSLAVKFCLVIVILGTENCRFIVSLINCESSWSCVKAETAIGVSCIDVSILVAVTITSSSWAWVADDTATVATRAAADSPLGT